MRKIIYWRLMFREISLAIRKWLRLRPTEVALRFRSERRKVMKRFFMVMAMLLVAATAQAADVGVSVSVGQPGFFGHIDIGNFPHPQVIYPRPIVVAPPQRVVVAEPIYLHVPPGHEKNWGKHCHKYNACDRRVYFVKERWYNNVYVPQHQQHQARRMQHGGGPDRGYTDRDRGNGRGHDRGGDHDGDRGHGRR